MQVGNRFYNVENDKFWSLLEYQDRNKDGWFFTRRVISHSLSNINTEVIYTVKIKIFVFWHSPFP